MAAAVLVRRDPQLRVKITKPLFALETPLGLCRSDFLIEATKGEYRPVTLIIEAFGIETEEYRKAKDKIGPRMNYLGPIFSLFPEDLAEANAPDASKIG
ncbi:hypothetical protein J2X76_004979 [Neorhizobium sp. 2083]|nr:hypothetical protein [Neorhizobium sp. 2083]MDR6819782.1 hypothetical protein [Neorhizobium sp. 2083]